LRRQSRRSNVARRSIVAILLLLNGATLSLSVGIR
jgi:hypothetical protein